MFAIGAGWGIEPNQRAVELAAADPQVFAAVGCHPHDAEKLDDEGRAKIAEWLGRPGVVAVGECGLDGYWVGEETFAEHDKVDIKFEVLLETAGRVQHQVLGAVRVSIVGDQDDISVFRSCHG